MTPVALKASLSTARRMRLPASLTLEEWTKTIADFAGLCAYCQTVPVAVLEHFVPMRHGGGTTPGNCLPACIGCNLRKGPLLPADFEAAFGPERVGALRAYLRGRSTGCDVAAPEQHNARSEIVVTRWTPAEAIRLDEIATELAPGAPDALTRADVLRALVASYNRSREDAEPKLKKGPRR